MTLSGNFFELSLKIEQFRNKLKLKIVYKILKIKKSNKIILKSNSSCDNLFSSIERKMRFCGKIKKMVKLL